MALFLSSISLIHQEFRKNCYRNFDGSKKRFITNYAATNVYLGNIKQPKLHSVIILTYL